MKSLSEYVSENLVNEVSKYKIKPRTNYELKVLINRLIIERGVNANLNDIDVSNIVDMSGIFSNFNSDSKNSRFNGDISEWNVSNVKDMCGMFQGSKFNGDISKWNVSNVKNMRSMFRGSKFNGDISGWDVSNVEDMESMFNKCPLENNPPEWYRK
jgi:surface protein